ncbi:YlaI family protein [Oceanobacillus manasiensis]|uniref:YlaI family protein n=1 Tax=Oceanobacillus manasiensis TaxID=586413 RepID=UPI0005A76B00|nr:YlaI family protein [Oceanobacillus manasiensis]
MQVKCAICDQVEDIEDNSLQAKRLRNRRIHMYLCNPCYDRIGENTKKRLATGRFRLKEEKQHSDDLI